MHPLPGAAQQIAVTVRAVSGASDGDWWLPGRKRFSDTRSTHAHKHANKNSPSTADIGGRGMTQTAGLNGSLLTHLTLPATQTLPKRSPARGWMAICHPRGDQPTHKPRLGTVPASCLPGRQALLSSRDPADGTHAALPSVADRRSRVSLSHSPRMAESCVRSMTRYRESCNR